MAAEGINQPQQEAVASLIGSLEREGVRTLCCIAFGSRAREEGRPDSDTDLVFFLDFNLDPSLLSDERLIQVKDKGDNTIHMHGYAGELHLILVNWEIIGRRLQQAQTLQEGDDWLEGLAQDGKIIYGKEPQLEGLPFLEYLKRRFHRQ